MIYVEPPPTTARLADILRLGGTYYFRCRTNKHRADVRKFIQDTADEVGVHIKAQGVTVSGCFQQVLKIETEGARHEVGEVRSA